MNQKLLYALGIAIAVIVVFYFILLLSAIDE